MKNGTPVYEVARVARAGLSGNWALSVGDVIVFGLLFGGVLLFPFASLLFCAPLFVGLHIYFLQTVRQRNATFPLLFSGFDRFGTSWCAYILVKLIMAAWMIPLGAAGAAIYLFVHPDPAVYPSYVPILLAVLPGVFAVVVLIVLQLRYLLVLYLVADDPTVRARAALQRSVELMKGNHGRFIELCLRFVGWGLLSVLTLGIGFLWLMPYVLAAVAAFYDDLSRKS